MPESFYFPVYSGILTPEHNQRMGPAIWVFLWCISKTTKEVIIENEQLGIVLGGKSVKYTEIAEDLGVSKKTISRYIGDLVEHGYLKTIQAKYGVIIQVRRSKKFPSKTDKIVLSKTSKEDKIVHSQDFKKDKSVHPEPSKEDKNVPFKPFKEDKCVHPNIDIKSNDINKDLDIKSNASLLDGNNGFPSQNKNESFGVPSTDLAVGEIKLSKPESDGVPSTVTKEISLSRQVEFEKIESHYIALRGTGTMTAADDDALIFGLISDNIPFQTIIGGIDKAFEKYKPKFPSDKIRKFSYCDAVIRDLHFRNTKRLEVVENRSNKVVSNFKPRTNNAIGSYQEFKGVPQRIIDQLNQQHEKSDKNDSSDPKFQEKQRKIDEMLRAMGEIK